MSQTFPMKTLRPRALIFISIFVVFFLVSFFGQILHSKGLMFRDTNTVMGRVLRHEPSNHSSVYYTYDHHGSTYEGVGSAENYKENDSIRISHSTSRPEVSEISERIPSLGNLVSFTLFGSLLCAAFGTAILSLGGKRGLTQGTPTV